MKKKKLFTCQMCSYQTAQWMGKCPQCNEWSTLVEVGPMKDGPVPQLIEDVAEGECPRTKTNIGEFDRVLGGGVVPGSLTLIGGGPGIGKSTLLLDVASRMGQHGKVLYVSGEESEQQVATRFRRLGLTKENVYVIHESLWPNLQKLLKTFKPVVIVIDSIQTLNTHESGPQMGGASQIREVTFEVMQFAKRSSIPVFIVGHITKDGNIAGPKLLEHMVDTVIYFEGDQLGHYRLLRVIKNRFGSTHEIGIFEMTENGLKEVRNPSQLFLDEYLDTEYGRAITCVVEGGRTLFVEIQGLVVEQKNVMGRRVTHGIDQNRLNMLLAVIEKYMCIPMTFNDIYVNVVGGLKLPGRDTDLAVVAGLLSSLQERPLSSETLFIGEVGLTGEIRSASQMEMRLKEICQMPYKRVVTSYRAGNEFRDKFPLEIIGLKSVSELEHII